LFWHRKSKADKNGYAPVICRISIDARNEEFTTGIKVHLDRWDVETKRVTSGIDAKKINSRFNQIQASLERHFAVLQIQHENITPLMLKNAFRNLPVDLKKGDARPGSTPNTVSTLLEVADKQVAEFKEMVAKNLRSAATLRQWKSTKKKIADFILYQFGQKDIELISIDLSFAHKFYTYLTVKRDPVLQNAAAKKQIKNTKQIMSLAEANGWIIKNPIEKFRCGTDEKEVIPLELHEVEKIWHKKLSSKRLIKVRDAFIFQCFTGFAYQDIYNLSFEHIVRVGSEGENWLIKERGKTKVIEMVPVLPIVEAIIEKYKNDTYCTINQKLIPVNSNVRYNAYLKELSDICGLNRDLNTHLARHTFADIMLNVLGFPLEDVSKMLGHKTIRTTQRYARVKKFRITERMRSARNLLFAEDGKLKSVGA
jgi:site-specific recombinase XerD